MSRTISAPSLLLRTRGSRSYTLRNAIEKLLALSLPFGRGKKCFNINQSQLHLVIHLSKKAERYRQLKQQHIQFDKITNSYRTSGSSLVRHKHYCYYHAGEDESRPKAHHALRNRRFSMRILIFFEMIFILLSFV